MITRYQVQPGLRVEFRQAVERFPFFIVPPFATGIIDRIVYEPEHYEHWNTDDGERLWGLATSEFNRTVLPIRRGLRNIYPFLTTSYRASPVEALYVRMDAPLVADDMNFQGWNNCIEFYATDDLDAIYLFLQEAKPEALV